MKKIKFLPLFFILASLLIVSCERSARSGSQAARQEGPGTGVGIVVYTNSGSDGRAEWLEDRAAQAGFRIQVLEAGAAAIQNRLLAEKTPLSRM